MLKLLLPLWVTSSSNPVSQEADREGGPKGRRGFFKILKGGFLSRKTDMGDHGDRDLLQGNARYRKLQDLNEGTFGVVMLALDTHAREQVAIKFLERGAGALPCKVPATHRLQNSPAT